MFLSSFFKKNVASTAMSPPVTSISSKSDKGSSKVEANDVNLPSWKDTAMWTSGKLKADEEIRCRELQETIFDVLKMVRDPEKPETLGELNVLTEDSVQVQPLTDGTGYQIRIDFNPTVPHCSLASVIGLCLRKKVLNLMADDHIKIDIVIAKGKHSTEEEINKQINDKERVAAAMENPNLKEIVESCIAEPE